MSGLLLDTCVFLWLIWDEPPLHTGVRERLADPGETLFLSAVSVWEATVKHARGRLVVRAPQPAWQHFTEERMRHGIEPLPVSEQDVRHLAALPPVHADPFDRLLICQAIENGLTLVTPDRHIRRYPIKTFW